MQPRVSICCLTYNHEKFIEEALKGFLIQKTNFPIEILVHDDASRDKTQQILKYYEKKDQRISVIYQKENKYSTGEKPFINYLFPKAKGKYIALCEGDDYWTDPYKLQKQIDFLEKNSKYSACFTNAKVINEDSLTTQSYLNSKENKSFNFKEILQKGGGLFPTASLVFRNILSVWPAFIFKMRSGDRGLSLLLGQEGDFYLLNEETCVYRIHGGGVFSSIESNKDARIELDRNNIFLLREFNKFTDFKYDVLIRRNISNVSKIALLRKNRNVFSKDTIDLFKNLNYKDLISYLYYFTFKNRAK